jgi:hypothetical protein
MLYAKKIAQGKGVVIPEEACARNRGLAAFDAGAITSDAGALLLTAPDRAIRMMDRLASCFHDVRCSELIEHQW